MAKAMAVRVAKIYENLVLLKAGWRVLKAFVMLLAIRGIEFALPGQGPPADCSGDRSVRHAPGEVQGVVHTTSAFSRRLAGCCAGIELLCAEGGCRRPG